MAWRLVQQPDGYLARFSSIVDSFTHYDMTPDEAIRLCIDEWNVGRKTAREKVQRARAAGIARWDEALEIIRAVHGEAEYAQLLSVMQAAILLPERCTSGNVRK